MFTKVKHFCALYLRVFPHCIAPAAFSACLCSAPVHPKPQLLASSVIFPNLLQPPPLRGRVPAGGRGGHFAGGGAGAALAAARWRPCAAGRGLALASWRWAACLRPVLSFMFLTLYVHGPRCPTQSWKHGYLFMFLPCLQQATLLLLISLPPHALCPYFRKSEAAVTHAAKPSWPWRVAETHPEEGVWELLLLGCLPQHGSEPGTLSPATPDHPLLLLATV